MLSVSVGGEAAGQIESGRAAGDDVEHTGGRDAAENLRYDVGSQFAGWETSGRPQAEGNGRVDVTARDGADGIGHGEQGEAEGERDTDKADAGFGEVAGQDRASAPAEDEPEGSDEFC